jgi:hypothetical protein
MFPNQPKTPKLPEGSKVTWVVKYQGGRKPFDNDRDARLFVAEQRALEKGWGELIQQTETVVLPR